MQADAHAKRLGSARPARAPALLHSTCTPSGHSSLTLAAALRTDANDCRSHSTAWRSAEGCAAVSWLKLAVDRFDDRLRTSTLAPSPTRVSAAIFPVPEVVPVITTVLPSMAGSLPTNWGKYFGVISAMLGTINRALADCTALARVTRVGGVEGRRVQRIRRPETQHHLPRSSVLQ